MSGQKSKELRIFPESPFDSDVPSFRTSQRPVRSERHLLGYHGGIKFPVRGPRSHCRYDIRARTSPTPSEISSPHAGESDVGRCCTSFPNFPRLTCC